MRPVLPYPIRRSEDGWRGELLLRFRGGKSVVIVQLSLEQARLLAVEMRGLATDHCSQHHLARLVVEALGARISHVVINVLDSDGGTSGSLRLDTPKGLRDANVDVAAALAMAFHLGLPISIDGAQAQSGEELRAIDGPTEPPVNTQLPEAFRVVIEGLDMGFCSDGLAG